MSYTVSVMGYGFSKEFDAEGSLADALGSGDLGAKYVSGDLGSFLQELGGMGYKEVDGGMYTWMLYRSGPGGSVVEAQEGLDLLRPRDGERIYVVYQFLPEAKPAKQPLYSIPEVTKLLEPEVPDYSLPPVEEYKLPELVKYVDFARDTEEEQDSLLELYEPEGQEVPLLDYSEPEFTLIGRAPQLKPVPRPQPAREPFRVPDLEGDRSLERFVMDVLAEARSSSLLEFEKATETGEAIMVRV